MTFALRKGYTRGTHRLIAPEETFAALKPHFDSFGITRCAEITGLDRIGIPVYCAIRPEARTLQVSNGKGMCDADAKVSACMEAIELHHAENPCESLERASYRSMRRSGRRVIRPEVLPDYRSDTYFSDDFIVEWLNAEDLATSREVWLAASAAYLCRPMLYHWSTNGLASGNHIVEATLHALYEVIERDTISSLSSRGWVHFSPKSCRFMDLRTVRDGPVRELRDRLAAADIKLVLIWVRNRVSVPTFMAVLLDETPFGPCSAVNIGFGSHLSVSVAAVRAITEAAQSRLTFIHGAREDMTMSAYQESHQEIYRFFNQIEGRTRWSTLRESHSNDLLEDYRRVVGNLSGAGYKKIFRVDMTRSAFEVPVAKVFVPGMVVNANLF